MTVFDGAHERLARSRRVTVLVDHLEALIPEGARVIDVGAGDGQITSALIERRPDLDVVAIDVLVHEPSRFSKERSVSSQPGISSVRVYDVKGRLVRSLMIDEVLHPGEHTLGWDGTDEAGTKVAAGVYYCRLRIGERSLTRRVILLR